VALTISASRTFTAGSDRKFNFEVDTSSMPAGKYTVSVGNKVRIVQLGPKGQGDGQNNGNLHDNLEALFSWIKQLGST
jgi:hypothetical protein